jgi:hypothetical protein
LQMKADGDSGRRRTSKIATDIPRRETLSKESQQRVSPLRTLSKYRSVERTLYDPKSRIAVSGSGSVSRSLSSDPANLLAGSAN